MSLTESAIRFLQARKDGGRKRLPVSSFQQCLQRRSSISLIGLNGVSKLREVGSSVGLAPQSQSCGSRAKLLPPDGPDQTGLSGPRPCAESRILRTPPSSQDRGKGVPADGLSEPDTLMPEKSNLLVQLPSLLSEIGLPGSTTRCGKVFSQTCLQVLDKDRRM